MAEDEAPLQPPHRGFRRLELTFIELSDANTAGPRIKGGSLPCLAPDSLGPGRLEIIQFNGNTRISTIVVAVSRSNAFSLVDCRVSLKHSEPVGSMDDEITKPREGGR